MSGADVANLSALVRERAALKTSIATQKARLHEINEQLKAALVADATAARRLGLRVATRNSWQYDATQAAELLGSGVLVVDAARLNQALEAQPLEQRKKLRAQLRERATVSTQVILTSRKRKAKF